MHKLAKGLKKKKKPKKGKKGAEEEEFDPEELERYRRERAEAQQKAEEAGESAKGTGSDEWKKFQALTAGVDSVLKKTQNDLDRIKSTSFFQRKAPLEEKKPEEAKQEDSNKSSSKRWVGFDKEGNPIEAAPPEIDGQETKEEKSLVNEDGFVNVPEDEDEQEDSADEDIFDTTYVDVLQNIDVQLAYIPDSPTEEETGDDPFDTTNADKVLRTVDKKGNKLVSLGNAVEVLSGRIDYVSTCKITKGRRPRIQQDLLLDDFDEAEQPSAETVVAEPTKVEKTLLDDDSDLPDIPIDLTKLPPVLPRPVSPVTPTIIQENAASTEKTSNGPLDISEFEVLKEKTILEEIPDLDDAEFDLNASPNESTCLKEVDDPFATKEPETDFQTEIIEASFEAATFVDEADPFDTTFADNILPGKTELKFIEKELEELPVSEVSISLTDPAGFNRDYETGLLKLDGEQKDDHNSLLSSKKDLLGGSTTDLSQLADEPIAPIEDITYVDPFDTSAVKELPPGKTELKVLEKELLGEQSNSCVQDDNDFDPRKDEASVKQLPTKPPPPRPSAPVKFAPIEPVFTVNFEEDEKVEVTPTNLERKASRPEVLELAPTKAVAFELPTPSKRPDLLATTEEEKTLPSKPLTPYYSQKSIEESLSTEDNEVDVDPFDTSFVNNVAPGKTELKLIESELLRQEPKLPHSLSDHDFDPRSTAEPIRRQSDFTATSVTPSNLKLAQLQSSLIQKVEEEVIPRQEPHRQESILDAEIEVDAKPLTPRIESKPIVEEEISYSDPFDTSIATNILPGKAELKILESELQQIPQQPPPRSIVLPTVVPIVASTVPEIDDFDPRANEVKESKDFLSLDGQDPGDKVLTPLQNKDLTLDDDVDPFDTSFATIEPGRTELKLLESELMKFNSIMDSKGGNPFLMDDYATEPGGGLPPQVSNPFLQDFTDAESSGASENPFLNFGSDQTAYEPPISVDSTNPFASFGIESTASNTGFGAIADTNTPATNVFTSQSSNIFVTSDNTNVDLFGTMTTTTAEKQPTIVSPPQPSPAATPPSKNGKPPPSRPPPPRPQPPPIPPPVQPPAKNTKDLILSVTGAMDATSNHLLDRLQATRTPSPTLIHSPSPTPEHSFADFLDVDSNVPDLIPDDKIIESPKNQDIMDLFDAPSEVTSTGIFSTSMTTTDTTSLITGVSMTTTTKDNPFASMSEEALVPQAQPTFGMEYPEDIISNEKRPSVTSATPFAVIETDVGQSGIVLDLTEPVPAIQPTLTAATELFQGVEQISTDADANFFSMTNTTTITPFGIIETTSAPFAAATQPLFAPSEVTQSAFASDLLGDFGEPIKEVVSSGLISTSPTPGTEFPGNEAYRPEEQLDNFAATTKAIEDTSDSFDAFASKFDRAAEPETNGGDPFLDAFGGGPIAMDTSSDVWGDSSAAGSEATITGFGESDGFDSFLSMTAPPPDMKVKRAESAESDEGPDFSVFIKPKEGDQITAIEGGPVPTLAPPPKSPQIAAYTDSSPRFNPFDKSGIAQDAVVSETAQTAEMARTDSQETPPTPLFDEDVSQPLEDFPRITYTGDGWEMQLRQPNKKKITGQRFWKKIFVKLVYQGDNPSLQLFNNKDDKDPFQELPLLACYSVSDIGAQQFDQYGKIFTVKLQYIFYKERPGVRPGQVTKAERLTNKLSQFAAYAIQGDYQGVKEFGSDLKKLGLPVEHAPQISQLFKLGSQCYENMKQFSCAIEEALFRLPAHRDRALTYKMEEVQVTVVDELYVEQNAEGHVDKQIARVRLFFLGFLSGMPDIELGINDMWRQGKEVVGRHDIIPVVTEEWIRLENVEFHSCVHKVRTLQYVIKHLLRFKPPDACYIELMRFRVRPPKNRELPLQLKAVMCVTGNKVELRADILVPGFASRKLGQIPCEDVMVRFPIPECWIYLFRVEKHFRYGSVKSAHRRTGKIKGIERFLGAVDTLEPQLMEVTSGQAKYEHQHRAIVWRMPRLPKEGQGTCPYFFLLKLYKKSKQ
ncbi:PREDICTED: protein stoned-B-like [Acromyrmex echinatior]|nr:PREDICTED: protein stoned-B-like [Acromyrmex echinatior]